MNRRTLSGTVVFGLLAALLAVAVLVPVPYVTMSPGPTINVLGETGGKQIIAVGDHKTYPTKGELRLVTVSVTSPGRSINLLAAMQAWFDRTRAVYPRDAIYPPQQSVQEAKQESSVEMVSSQDTAVAAALTELGYSPKTYVEVLGVTKGAPADGKLKVRDQILSVNGTPVTGVRQVSKLVQQTPPSQPARFVVRRDGRTRTVTVQPEKSSEAPHKAIVGITIGLGYDFPFSVDVRLNQAIGGPSAGLMFSLGVYDRLTPGALTGGKTVAGTGTITERGRVGPIGGIQQKIVAAAEAGATLFFVPPANCTSALHADVKEGEIRLVKAPTMHSAVESLKAYADDPHADLPSCR
jgi:PDZ domain-containing protein